MAAKYNEYWLLLSPKVHVEIKREGMLLYHTENGECIESVSVVYRDLVLELQKDINLGVIEFAESYRSSNEVTDFVADAVRKDIFILMPIEKDKPKPVVLLPILNLQRDIDKLSEQGHEYFVGRDILNYLNHLNVYIHGDCDLACNVCNSYYKQFPFCTKRTDGDCLSPEDVHNILSQVQFSNTGTVNILGGDLCLYDPWERLWEVFDEFEFQYHLRHNLLNLPNNRIWMANALRYNLDILITPDAVLSQHDDRIDDLAGNSNVSFHFVVESEDDCARAELLAERIGVDKVKIVPFYNNANLGFFKDNIFLNREDIFTEPISMRTIFCNQKLNSNFFGSLTILPNGDVIASPNKPVLGNIHRDQLIKLIYNEMLSKSSWRYTRNGEKCSACLYQYLCPPPSNYELSMGRENLCNVR